ncbi:hypothetical protein [Anaeromyxobacter dehalogenans]|uniref:hypothetical protein n=1 Tax=Anaeromyxobacter dehalogenans TaxID=161493 RepID=UPI0003140395|nr:hypothetical protein [Anaeromyxobacter dehalogenans]
MPLRLALGALLVLAPRLAFAGVTIHYEGTAETAAAAKAVIAAAPRELRLLPGAGAVGRDRR